ncbi:unnamed protein product [Rotaria sp. Silwood2]|nr:unnamed protein product [Rotaria sp. Silwood2]CAF3227465.1 unnamed protein product [Rotaria sp. Silwood2]CAF3997438.1 unnamed protein product [Rotaria sp. Silwood2]CAF4100462.1 unnamed protein product [Rotaria sp. Silwood2]
MYFYSVVTDKLISVQIGTVQPSFITWSDDDRFIYFVAAAVRSKEEEDAHRAEWKNVINYRQGKPGEGSVIYRIDIDTNNPLLSAKVSVVANVSLLIGELLYVPYEQQLVFTSRGKAYEDLDDFEIYSIRLNSSSSSLSRLTYMEGVEQELQLSSDGKHVLFRLWALSSGKVQTTQRRLCSLDLINGQINRLAKNFDGVVTQYTVKSGGGVYIIGQLGLNVQIYTQESLTDYAIYRHGWNGTYERFASSSHRAGGPVAFAFSSLERPKEVYLAESIDQLMSAKPITNDNELFTQRDLPQATAYHWKNTADNQVIEGVLHYPPGKFNAKNLPLLILIHGGPNVASVNELQATWNWATMAATEGWLVLEPNYRGSTGYGDKFLGEIRHRLLSLPGQDILMGVDQLTKDGIADPKRLAVGGYSYGGFLTNWLITQTTRFNAALSGAGGIEHVSGWGTMDLPVLLSYLHGGFPWEVPQVYQSESPIYQMNKVRTPTHIVIGEYDARVDTDQSFILERSLHYLGIPVQLLVFPNEGHAIANDPWNGKIKVREELKWLQKYGNQSLSNVSNGCDTKIISLFIIFISLSIFISKIYFF